MSTLTTTLLSLILSVPVAPQLEVEAQNPAPVAYEISASQWKIEEGDRVVVDTKNNEGFLMHKDGRYMNFEVVTGQRKWVYYIGRSYNASTPNWSWTAKSLHVKGDRMTFGPSGRFLRLYKDGSEHTAYGFHEYGDESEMFDDAQALERFRSMGCIIVRVPMMNLLVDTFEKNGSIDVLTQHGIEDLQEIMLSFEDSTEVALY